MRPAVTTSGLPSASDCQGGLRQGLAVDLDICSLVGDGCHDTIRSEHQLTRDARDARVREHHRIGFRRAERIFTFPEPIQTGQREPAVVGGQSFQPTAPPFLDLGGVGRIDRRRRLGAGGQAEQQW